jgi:hypothetical protein
MNATIEDASFLLATLYTLFTSTGQHPRATIGPRSFQDVHVFLREPMTISIVNASVLLRFPELIHDLACF